MNLNCPIRFGMNIKEVPCIPVFHLVRIGPDHDWTADMHSQILSERRGQRQGAHLMAKIFHHIKRTRPVRSKA